MATILGVISLASLVTVVILSGNNGGEATVGYAITGILAFLFSVTGIILGTVTLRDKNYYRLFPVLGVILNLLAIGGISLILYAGANL